MRIEELLRLLSLNRLFHRVLLGSSALLRSFCRLLGFPRGQHLLSRHVRRVRDRTEGRALRLHRWGWIRRRKFFTFRRRSSSSFFRLLLCRLHFVRQLGEEHFSVSLIFWGDIFADLQQIKRLRRVKRLPAVLRQKRIRQNVKSQAFSSLSLLLLLILLSLLPLLRCHRHLVLHQLLFIRSRCFFDFISGARYWFYVEVAANYSRERFAIPAPTPRLRVQVSEVEQPQRVQSNSLDFLHATEQARVVII